MQIKAALAMANKGPLTIEDIDMDEPGPGELVVRIVATGLCHTDLTVLANVPLPWPAILGHEGAGVVEKVGAGVTKVSPGDHVLMTTTSCGTCKNCKEGQPSYCLRFRELNMSGGYRQDGSCSHRHHGKPVFARFLGQSSFASHVLAGQGSVIKVAKELPLDLIGPLGCGVQTGAGAVLNTMRPRPGSSFAVFGAGAVGLSALMAAKIAGCTTLIAIDKVASRLDLAREVGATHVIDAGAADAVAAIRELTGTGVDYAVEATGVPAVMEQAISATGFNGCVVLVGVAGSSASVSFNPTELQNKGVQIKGSMMAGEHAVPDVFIPQLIGFWQKGMLPFEKLVRHYEFADINDAVHDAHDGTAIKPVIRMPQ
ncbi:NAD(P)-dependent alcohol dehydrogenase [Paraburkholderia saeva]|uniref:NAD(P)-dependent alcohol dehydrogenase n=1 Tax=Paraburkholderia saeva TaxID=2777537 RepID=UPI001DD3639B|nr:NAD(P)-dependent alcohol dehydrogenase [Paraburkholderia saeva]CAG4895954.1 Aryl-alcohol dehydrogenase [Paraburkholderia saeva]